MFGGTRLQSTTALELHARDDMAILDVREPAEWRAGHIPGSVHIPMGQVTARTNELDADRPVAVVCRSGQRSARVTAFLAQQGYDASNLEGGLQAWLRAGLPLTADDGGEGTVA